MHCGNLVCYGMVIKGAATLVRDTSVSQAVRPACGTLLLLLYYALLLPCNRQQTTTEEMLPVRESRLWAVDSWLTKGAILLERKYHLKDAGTGLFAGTLLFRFQ